MEQLVVGDVLRSGKADNRPGLLLVGQGSLWIDSELRRHAASRVADADDLRSCLGEEPRGNRTGVAESLDHDRCALERVQTGNRTLLDGSSGDEKTSARRGFVPSKG